MYPSEKKRAEGKYDQTITLAVQEEYSLLDPNPLRRSRFWIIRMINKAVVVPLIELPMQIYWSVRPQEFDHEFGWKFMQKFYGWMAAPVPDTFSIWSDNKEKDLQGNME